jgi:hypothetical protein
MNIKFLLLLFLWTSGILWATTEDTFLNIFEKGTHKRLHHVRIFLNKEIIESDKQGRASLKIPPQGDGLVRFMLGSYETLEVNFENLRPPGEFDIFLIPTVEADNTIIVKGKKKSSQVSRKTVSITEASKIAPNADPVQVIKLFPGVQSQLYRPDAIIRGSRPDDSLYYIDDLQVPFIFHGVGDLSVIPSSMMQTIQFDSGGFGSEKGNATGGVIVVRTKTDLPERPKTEFILNLPFYSGIFHTRPLDEKSSLSIGVRRSYIDFLIRKILEEQNKKDGKLKGSLTLVPYFGDAQISYLERSENSYTKLSLLGAYDGLKAGFPSDSFADTQGQGSVEFYTGFVNTGLEHVRKLDENWTLHTTPQLYYFNTNANIFTQTFNLNVWNFKIPTYWDKSFNSNQSMEVGIEPSFFLTRVRYNAIVYDDTDPTFDPEDAPLVKTDFYLRYFNCATWLNFDQKLGNLTLSPGLRVFEDGEIKKTSADPRLRTRYALDRKNTLKSAIGQYSKSPSPQESAPDIGNPQLNFQRSYHYILGLETQWNEAWYTDFELYYKTAFNIVSTDAVTRYNNKGSFKSQGFEVFIRRNLTERFFSFISYTFSKSLSRENSTVAYHNSDYDQTHIFYWAGNYTINAKWDVGGRFNTHTGDTYTPISKAVYNTGLDKYNSRIDKDSQNSARLPQHNALSFYFTYKFLLDRWNLNLRFGMESFWATPPVLRVSYNYDYTKSQYRTGLSSIPFLELKGEF